jgi:hypothetical protein
MSSKKKRFAKGLGASVLTVATLASGLSFGAAPASALTRTPGIDPDKPAHSSSYGALYGKYGGTYVAYIMSGADLSYRHFSTADEARDAAVRVSVPAGSFAQQLRVEATDLCLSLTATNFVSCDPSDAAQRFFVEDASGPRPLDRPNSWLVPWNTSWAEFTESGQKTEFAAPFSGFYGAVDSIDVPAREALVSGIAAPAADVVLRWGDGEFEDQTRVNDDGVWDTRLDELELGSNPVKLLQYENQEITAEYDLDVELRIADLVVDHAFGTDRDDLVTLSGTAHPGAVVQVFNEDDQMVVASEPANAISGAWSVELPAPNKGGKYDLNVYQSLQGERASKTAVSVDYGRQLLVERPEDGFLHPGGQVDVRGKGEPGAVVEVREGDRLVGGPATVRDTQNWSLKTADLNENEHELKVTQKSKGGNVQTETIVVNPGEGTVELTADGRFDAADPTKPATAFGAAPTGSSVVLRNSIEQEIGRTVAKGDGYEIPIDPDKATSGANSFSVVIEGAPEDVKSFTLNYGAPAAPVVVTTPAKDGTVAPGTVAFAGTGQAGSKVVVRGSTREVASAKVNGEGAWSANSTMELGTGDYDLYFDQIGKGGLTSTIRHRFTIGAVTPIVTPHTVTSPGEGEVLDTLAPVFRGTGHEGATISVRGSSREVASGTVVDGQWVAKTDPNKPLAPGEYNLYVDQSIRGTLVGTIRVHFIVSNESFRQLTLSAPAQDEQVMVLRPTFVGTATPGAEIRVASSRTEVATTTVGQDGTWRATADFDLKRGGEYRGLEVKQTTASGKTSTVSANFTVDRNAQ